MRQRDVYYADVLGKPFRSGGKGPEAFDCWGLYRFLANRNGLAVPDFESVVLHSVSKIARRVQACLPRFTKVPAGGEQLLDGVLMWNDVPRVATHIGIIVQPGSFLHVPLDGEVEPRRLDDPLWQPRIMGIYRYAG